MASLPRTFGHYVLELELGKGGMGVVYQASDARHGNRPVAIKVLAESLGADDDYRTRFLREAEIVASLTNPHIIPIYEYDEVGGLLYLAMPKIDGADLTKMLRDGPLPPSRATAIVSQVADALDAAHARGIIHRDVKPSNVLVTQSLGKRSGRDHAYLIDFGIARGASVPALTMVGRAIGTLDYMAPERLEGQQADARSDVYALGCLLYEAVVGHAPFPGLEPGPLMRAHLSGERPLASRSVAGLSPELDAVVTRAMAVDPRQRYATAGEMADAALAAGAASGAATLPSTPLPNPFGSDWSTPTRAPGRPPSDPQAPSYRPLPPTSGDLPATVAGYPAQAPARPPVPVPQPLPPQPPSYRPAGQPPSPAAYPPPAPYQPSYPPNQFAGIPPAPSGPTSVPPSGPTHYGGAPSGPTPPFTPFQTGGGTPPPRNKSKLIAIIAAIAVLVVGGIAAVVLSQGGGGSNNGGGGTLTDAEKAAATAVGDTAGCTSLDGVDGAPSSLATDLDAGVSCPDTNSAAGEVTAFHITDSAAADAVTKALEGQDSYGNVTTPLTATNLLAGTWALYDGSPAQLAVVWPDKKVLVVASGSSGQSADDLLAKLRVESWAYGAFGETPDLGSAAQLASQTSLTCTKMRRQEFSSDDYPLNLGWVLCDVPTAATGFTSVEFYQVDKTATLATDLAGWTSSGFTHMEDLNDSNGVKAGECLYKDLGTASAPNTVVRCTYPATTGTGNMEVFVYSSLTTTKVGDYFLTHSIFPKTIFQAR